MSCAEYSDEYCAEYHMEYMYVEYTKVNIGGFVLKERETFGSRLGFILVSAGCAVGLGNVWKLPYICGFIGGALGFTPRAFKSAFIMCKVKE